MCGGSDPISQRAIVEDEKQPVDDAGGTGVNIAWGEMTDVEGDVICIATTILPGGDN